MSNKPLRRLGFGLATLFRLSRFGFFIPYRYAGQVPAWRDIPPYQAIEALLAKHEPGFADLLVSTDAYQPVFRSFLESRPPNPRWAQDWFPRLDGAAAYTLVRCHRPRQIIEVGCGHSTRFLARAVRDEGCDSRITAIDPHPRADIRSLPISLVQAPLGHADLALFDLLQAGDILFMDSSHLALPGTDVDLLVARILPRLPAGVLVHIHDIFLPDPYPGDWEWRGYNEQVAIAALLVGGGFDVVWSSRYVATRMVATVRASFLGTLPLPPGAVESSLWLRKTVSRLG